MDRSKACVILGLNENATRDEILKRYNILSKRYKYRDQEEGTGYDNILAEITEAYNVLMGYGSQSQSEEIEAGKVVKKHSSKSKLFKAFTKDHIESLLIYYKLPLAAGLLILVVALVCIGSMAGRSKVDLVIGFGGLYKPLEEGDAPSPFYDGSGWISQNENKFINNLNIESNILKNVEDIRNIAIQKVSLEDEPSGYGKDMQVRTVTMLMGNDIDVFICTPDIYYKLAMKELLMPVEKAVYDVGIGHLLNDKYIVELENGEEEIFGINAMSSKILEGLGDYMNNEVVISAARESKSSGNAIKLIRTVALS